jgi:hypothetical protein
LGLGWTGGASCAFQSGFSRRIDRSARSESPEELKGNNATLSDASGIRDLAPHLDASASDIGGKFFGL